MELHPPPPSTDRGTSSPVTPERSARCSPACPERRVVVAPGMTTAPDAQERTASGPVSVRSQVTDATVPLQWPLVGRHEELELFGATLDDPRAHGFVIHGPPGVGKTRLADQCLSIADGRGRNVARATATAGLGAVPLGALSHLLPPGIGDERVDLVKVMVHVRPVLLEQGERGRLVLFVDDLHLLDPTSAAF